MNAGGDPGARSARASTDELWERFAAESAERYILTDRGFGGEDVDLDRFFELGERDAQLILDEVQPWLEGHGTAVEIGCGVGRLAIPMAGRFRRVVAIDVSPTMLAKCSVNAEARGMKNVLPLHTADAGALELQADLVFSHLVLQHVEDFGAIDRYLELTRSWLVQDGVARLQFDTRPQSVGYRLRERLPDVVLRPTWRRGIRRVRRSREDVVAAMRRAGLVVVDEIDPSSEQHIFVGVRADRA
ncbi:MAG: hypothetical protein V7644_2628 [Actinomycetota bacterium]|jgi:cyclopropane fatty-acyl-phospholipid synthase-like methyltransferase